jgi:hypothetical protein
MFALLNKVLSLLPFNGDKTKLGVLAILIDIVTQIDKMCATCGLHDLVVALTSNPISYLAVGLAVLGLLHKWIKVKTA